MKSVVFVECNTVTQNFSSQGSLGCIFFKSQTLKLIGCQVGYEDLTYQFSSKSDHVQGFPRAILIKKGKFLSFQERFRDFFILYQKIFRYFDNFVYSNVLQRLFNLPEVWKHTIFQERGHFAPLSAKKLNFSCCICSLMSFFHSSRL